MDLVLENASGQIVGLEIKSASNVKSEDFKGLRFLAEQTGKKFLRGAVLYSGEDTIPFGPNLHAVPIGALWDGARAGKPQLPKRTRKKR